MSKRMPAFIFIFSALCTSVLPPALSQGNSNAGLPNVQTGTPSNPGRVARPGVANGTGPRAGVRLPGASGTGVSSQFQSQNFNTNAGINAGANANINSGFNNNIANPGLSSANRDINNALGGLENNINSAQGAFQQAITEDGGLGTVGASVAAGATVGANTGSGVEGVVPGAAHSGANVDAVTSAAHQDARDFGKSSDAGGGGTTGNSSGGNSGNANGGNSSSSSAGNSTSGGSGDSGGGGGQAPLGDFNGNAAQDTGIFIDPTKTGPSIRDGSVVLPLGNQQLNNLNANTVEPRGAVMRPLSTRGGGDEGARGNLPAGIKNAINLPGAGSRLNGVPLNMFTNRLPGVSPISTPIRAIQTAPVRTPALNLPGVAGGKTSVAIPGFGARTPVPGAISPVGVRAGSSPVPINTRIRK